MYNLNSNKLYFSENLSCVNGNVAFKARKIKSKVFIHACFMKDGVAHSKLGEHGKCIKILHKSHFNSYILDFEEEEFDFFHDVSQEMNNSVLIWKITFLWFSHIIASWWVVSILWTTLCVVSISVFFISVFLGAFII